jgi:hypothetical protein
MLSRSDPGFTMTEPRHETDEQERYRIRLMLSMYDPRMLTSPDGKRVEVNLSAIYRLVAHGERVSAADNASEQITPVDDGGGNECPECGRTDEHSHRM